MVTKFRGCTPLLHFQHLVGNNFIRGHPLNIDHLSNYDWIRTKLKDKNRFFQGSVCSFAKRKIYTNSSTQSNLAKICRCCERQCWLEPFFSYRKKYLYICIKTSPPYARIAVMTSMQTNNFETL